MSVIFVVLATIFEIALPENPQPWETTAADELRSVLGQRVTRRMTVEDVGNVRFHVGDTAFAVEKGLAASSFLDEEWIVRSFGRDIVLNGGGSHGALYAVSHFLEDVCDVRFWNDNDTDIPVSEELALPKLEMKGRPVFRYRDIYRSSNAAVHTPRLAIMRRLNRNGDALVPRAYGGEFTYGPPYHCHTFDLFVPWAKYGKTHPEWFSLWHGKRVGGRITGDLCLSQPEVRRLLMKGVLDSIAAGVEAARKAGVPEPRLYDLSQNDGGTYCECQACREAMEKYGHSGLNLIVVNEVADEVAKKYPGIFLTTLAYHHTEDLPKCGVRPRDNVIVKLCDTRSNQAAPITDACNRKWFELVSSWGKVAKNLMIWDYATVFANPSVFFPLPTERTLAETYRAFHENRVFGVFLEHEHTDLADFFDIKYYLESQFMENPYQDSDALVADAFSRYFGAGAPFAMEARQLLDACRRKSGDVIIYYPRTADYDFIARADADRMKALFDRAEAAVANDAKRLRHVRRARRSADAIFRVRRATFDPEPRTVSWTPDAVERCDRHLLSLVKDPTSPTGHALRIAAPDIEFLPPFGFEMYDAPAGKIVADGKLTNDAKKGYVWDAFRDVTIPVTENSFVYLTRSWTARLRLCHPDLNGKTGTLRILSRVEGTTRFIARLEFVCNPGRFPFEVILPKTPRSCEVAAAKELETILSKCARKCLTVGRAERIKFHVGDTFLAWEKECQSTMLADGEWVVRSFGRDVLVSGGGTNGTQSAVVHFLEDACGVRFRNDGETVVHEAEKLDLPPLNLHGHPVLRNREVYLNKDARTLK